MFQSPEEGQQPPDIVRVHPWDSKPYLGNSADTSDDTPYLVELCDLRKTSGQVSVVVGPESGNTDEIFSVSVEISRLPGQKLSTPVAHLHFGNGEVALSIFKHGDSLFVRPEMGVRYIPHNMPDGTHGLLIQQDETA